MRTECSTNRLAFQPLGRREVAAAFDGGTITSDAGGLLLREVEQRTGIIRQFAACFVDHRDADLIEHTVQELVAQRIYGLALGYEDLNDHDQLRRDPLLAMLVGKADPTGQERARERDKGKPLAGKSTLNRLELTPVRADARSRYKKIVADMKGMEGLFVEFFLQAHSRPPQRIVLDFDATDDPVHGDQLGRFFHGYYREYCFLPLYLFCGDELLGAWLRPADIDGSAGAIKKLAAIVKRIRQAWPHVKIVIRGDSGFCREPLMRWCEENRVDYVLGLAKNRRLEAELQAELAEAKQQYAATGHAARVFKDFSYQHAGQLEPIAAGGGQGGASAQGRQSAVRGDLALRRGSTTRGRSTRWNTAAAGRWRTASRSSNAFSSPTAPAPRRCVPTSCGCGSPRWPTSCCRRCGGWG